MRTFFAIAFACACLYATPAEAKPDLSREFTGDRYSGNGPTATPQRTVAKAGRKASRKAKRTARAAVGALQSHGLGPRPRASCGWTMRAMFGGKYGPEFNRARAWASLPRTSLQPGAVVVTSRNGKGCGGPCGHVVKVVSVIDQCRAVVQDNKGTYTRDTCRRRVAVVMP